MNLKELKEKNLELDSTLSPLTEEEAKCHEECIDYRWSLQRYKHTESAEVTTGYKASPWNEGEEVYYTDSSWEDLPRISKPILYGAKTVAKGYSLTSLEEARKIALGSANNLSLTTDELWSPAFVPHMSLMRANEFKDLSSLRLLKKTDEKKLKWIIDSWNKIKKASPKLSLWHAYVAVFAIGDYLLAEEHFYYFYADLLCTMLAKNDFSPIEFHIHRNKKHILWGENGFNIPEKTIFDSLITECHDKRQ